MSKTYTCELCGKKFKLRITPGVAEEVVLKPVCNSCKASENSLDKWADVIIKDKK